MLYAYKRPQSTSMKLIEIIIDERCSLIAIAIYDNDHAVTTHMYMYILKTI